VKPLPPAALVLGEGLAQPCPVAQLLDLLRRDPRLRQHLLRQQPRQPARVKPIRLRAPTPAQQRPRLHRLGQTNIEAAAYQLAPDPTPPGRRLDRDRRHPAAPR
jgi:hypothetical protein